MAGAGKKKAGGRRRNVLKEGLVAEDDWRVGELLWARLVIWKEEADQEAPMVDDGRVSFANLRGCTCLRLGFARRGGGAGGKKTGGRRRNVIKEDLVAEEISGELFSLGMDAAFW